MSTVIISVPAFLSMVLSSIEVYRKESFGILVGSKLKNKYHVNYAVNFQSAERHYEYIEMDMKRINRLNSMLHYLVNKKVIGDFHSHAEQPDVFSKYDLKELINEGSNFVSVLVVVKKREKSSKWRYKGNQTIVGGSLGSFYIRMVAKEYNPKKKKCVPVKIKLKNMKELNKIAKHYEELWTKLESYHKKEIEIKKRKQKLKQRLKLK